MTLTSEVAEGHEDELCGREDLISWLLLHHSLVKKKSAPYPNESWECAHFQLGVLRATHVFLFSLSLSLVAVLQVLPTYIYVGIYRYIYIYDYSHGGGLQGWKYLDTWPSRSSLPYWGKWTKRGCFHTGLHDNDASALAAELSQKRSPPLSDGTLSNKIQLGICNETCP